MDWSPESYERAVQQIILRIKSTQSGRAIVNALRHNVQIVPYDFSVASSDQCNAGTRIQNRSTVDANARALRRGVELPYNNGNNTITGRGTGTAGIILYTPGFFSPGNQLYCLQSGAGLSPEEVLVHEILHTVAYSNGIADPRTLPAPLSHFHSVGEYYAVVITNIYSSERGLTLRGEYPGVRPLTDPVGFYHQNRNDEMIGRFCVDLPELSRALSRIPCNFNPIREHYRANVGLPASTNYQLRVRHKD